MKRLNWKLVIGLAVGFVVTVIGGWGIHRLQISNTAHKLLEEGKRLHVEAVALKTKEPTKKAETFEMLDSAAEMLSFHLKFNPDNPEVADEAALIYHEMLPLATPKEINETLGKAISAGEMTVVNFPQQPHKEVREKLVDLYMAITRFGEAQTHLDSLLKDDPKNQDLVMKQARCLAVLAKEDDAAVLLRSAIKADPHQIDAYVLLSNILRDRGHDVAAANAVLDDLVAANPESYRAYLARASVHMNDPEMEEKSRLDVDKAMELAPKEIEVLMAKIRIVGQSDDPDKAEVGQLRERIEAAIKADDKNERLYLAIWQLSQLDRNPEESLKILEDGALRFPESSMMLQLLAEQYFASNQIDKVREKVKELEKQKNVRPENVKFFQACIDMADRKWEDAVQKFNEVRPLMATNVTSIDLRLGQLYRILDRPNEAKVVYERVVSIDPKSVPGRAGIAFAEYRLGRPTVALNMLNEIKTEIGLEKFAQSVELRNLYIELQSEVMKSLPEHQRDWGPLNEVVQAAQGAGKTPDGKGAGNAVLAEIQLAIAQGDVAKAKKLMEEALKLEPKNAGLWAMYANLIADEPGGMAKALDLVRKKSTELNQPLQLRVLEIALVSSGSNTEQVVKDLQKLAEGVDSRPEAEQERVYRDLGAAFQRVNRLPEALTYWRKARKVQPSDSNILAQMFSAVRASADDALMQEVIGEIRERFSADSEELLVAEASRIITLVDDKQLPKERLSDAKAKLEELERRNSRSGPLSRLQGDIARIEGDTTKCIEFLRQAVERNERDPVMIATLAHLLTIRGQQEEADQLLERLNAAGYGQYTEKVRNVQQARQGNYEGLILILEQHLQKNDSDLSKWIDLAVVLRQAGRNGAAEERLRGAVTKFPADERSWVALVAHQAATNQRAKAEATLEEARKTVPPEKLQGTVAMCREAIGPPGQAAKEYDLWLSSSPNDLRAMRAAAAFRLTQFEADPAQAAAHLAAAMQVLDRMIGMQSTDVAEDRQFVSWARTRKAQALGSTKRHRDFQAAIKLLDDNAKAGEDTSADRLLRAKMYATRPEKVYQREGVRLLQQLRQQDLLSPTESLGLVQLLNDTGEWTQGRTILAELVNAHPENPLFPAVMVKMLIDHNEVQQSATYLDSLAKIDPKSQYTISSRGRVLIASGKAAEGVATLKSLVPRPLPPGQENLLYSVAQLLDELKQTDAAEVLYQEFYAARPASILSFAEFRARHGRTDAALDLCASAMTKGFAPAQVVHVGNAALRQAKPAPTPAQCKRVESWIDQGLASNPNDAQTLKLMRAELFDLQGQYDEVERIYRETLSEPGISDAQKALVGNNLGYLLAMRGQGDALDDALKMVNEAIDILGPTSDLLDTRAMVQLARKDSRKAIEDLEVAINEEPSGSKLFHLALAQMDAGLKDKAQASYQKAKDDYGFSASDLGALEAKEFERLKGGLGL
jgi:tetratricopeptide (TPR) repeat protein